MRSFRAVNRLAVLSCAVLAMVGCQQGSFIHDIDVDVTGSYTLREVGTQTLPYTTGAGNQAVTITNVTLVLKADMTWTQATARVRSTTDGTVSDTLTDNGTYTKSGADLTLHSNVSNSTIYTGSYSTNSLTLKYTDGLIYLFSI